jgi:uncharacterized surface protein with fasciclin (FAS1) repeats
MKISRALMTVGLGLVVAVVNPVSADCGASHAEKNEKALGTIVDAAVANGSFKTLVAAVKAAGLVETLQGEGPYTVFAPTDDAFAKLPAGTVESLLGDPDALREVLLYHVVPGKVPASDVVSLSSAKTAQGSMVDIQVRDGAVQVDEASVIATDIETSNGIIHVIDTVIIPED